MKEVVTVIPIYKPQMTKLELISLQQCIRILGRHPIYILAPESLDISSYLEMGEMGEVRFPDDNFSNLAAYSRLCLNHEFYVTLKQFDYVLIYQLDAFVFSDRLMEFCEKGYDFIGAPAPSSAWKGLPYNVGNGGFSLRKVQSFLQITSQLQEILSDFVSKYGEVINGSSIYNMEDCIFGYCGWHKNINFRVPSVEEAFDFSIEFNINGIYKELNTHIPFGCHRWHTYRFSTWWDIIKGYGYEIDADIYSDYSKKYQWHEYRVLMSMIERDERINEVSEVIRDIIHSKKIRLWGGGREGIKIARNIKKMGLDICVIYDKNASSNNVLPTIEALRSSNIPIIISSLNYDEEIAKELNGMGLDKEIDYYLWKDIVVSLNECLGINDEGETLR